MNRRGPYNDAFDTEESSGVTTMAPVPAKTLRLSELDEKDRTAYFSVTALMERGKAVAARSEPPLPVAPPPAAHLPPAPPVESRQTPGLDEEVSLPLERGVLQQLREASPARKATLVVLPLLIGLLALKPVFKKDDAAAGVSPAPSAAASHAPMSSQHVAESEQAPAAVAPTPAEPPAPLPKGVTLERAASDALAGGDFARALGFYRQLSRQNPEKAAYKEATRILERRQREKQP